MAVQAINQSILFLATEDPNTHTSTAAPQGMMMQTEIISETSIMYVEKTFLFSKVAHHQYVLLFCLSINFMHYSTKPYIFFSQLAYFLHIIHDENYSSILYKYSIICVRSYKIGLFYRVFLL